MPTTLTVIAAQIVMAVTAAVGMIGSGLHMVVSGVSLENLSRIFSSAVWGGPASPNWPVAIAVAAVLGFVASVGANRNSEPAPGHIGVTASIAYVLIVIAIGLSTMPSVVMVSASCLVLAALLLLAVLIGMLATARERSAT